MDLIDERLISGGKGFLFSGRNADKEETQPLLEGQLFIPEDLMTFALDYQFPKNIYDHSKGLVVPMYRFSFLLWEQNPDKWKSKRVNPPLYKGNINFWTDDIRDWELQTLARQIRGVNTWQPHWKLSKDSSNNGTKGMNS